MTNIDEILKNQIVDRHSYFQLKHFIVAKEPTHQARMWRCIRELKARKDSLDSIFLELEDAEDGKKLLELKKQRTDHGIDQTQEEIEIGIRKNARQQKSLDKRIEELKTKSKFIKEEADFFVEMYSSLEKIGKLLPFDESQEDYWSEKLMQEVNIRALLNQPPDLELFKTILSLDDSSVVKNQVIKILTEAQTEMLKMRQKQPLLKADN